MTTANPHHPTPLRPGEKLDKFEVVSQIGAGGTSIVWKGYDRLLDRFVAIKQLLPDAGPADADQAEAFCQRFRQEAQIQKRVAQNHKNLVRVIDFIDEPRGLFIVMEYVDGLSLEQVLSQYRGPMDERRALGIVGAAAMALETIHDAGAIHRDLKPANILLPKHGGLKVGDFGLAALMAQQQALSLGSVRYMAPELFHDDPVDGRADIYALGMIAYEMLAGRNAFEDAFKIVLRDKRNQPLRWMKWHTNPRVKAPPLSQLNPKASPSLSELVGRMIEKDPASRIASAHELLRAIRRHFTSGDEDAALAGSEAAETAPPTAGSDNPTAPLPRRGKLVPILIAILAVQILLGSGVMLLIYHRDRQHEEDRRNNAMAIWQQAMDDYRRDQFDRAADKFKKLAAAWPDDPTLGTEGHAWAMLSHARSDLAAGRYDAALPEFEQVDQSGVFEKSRDKIQGYRNQASSGAAFVELRAKIEEQIVAGQFGQARQLIEEARRIGPTPEESARLDALAERNEDQALRARVADVLARSGEMDKAGQRDQAIALLIQARKHFRSSDVDRLLAQLQRDKSSDQARDEAQAAENHGDLAAAIAGYTKAAQIKPDEAMTQKIGTLKGRQALEEGRKLLHGGDTAGARDKFTASVGFHDNPEARAELAKIESADQREGFLHAGDAAVEAKEYETAVTQYDNALKLAPDDAVTVKRDAARMKADIESAQTLMTQGKLKESRDILKRILAAAPTDADARSALADLEHHEDYQKQLDAGDALAKKGRFDDAKEAYLRAKKILPTPEVAGRIDDTEYNQLIARVRLDISSSNWNDARALLDTATQDKGATGEIRQLYTEVQKHLTAGEEK